MEKLVVFFVCVVVVCGVLVSIAIYDQAQHDKDVVSFENRLTVQLRKGIIQSPAIIIELESKEEFFATILDLEVETVYWDNIVGIGGEIVRYYYVFTNDYSIAYRWTIR